MSQVIDADPNSIRVALKVVDETAGDSPLKLVTAVFDAKRVQPVATGGLSFGLTLRNDSKQVLKVQSPLEALQISLLDGKGWPVQLLPSTPPRTLINYKGSFQAIRPYQVVAIKALGADRDLMEIRDDLNWTLPAADALRTEIKIDRILPRESAGPSAQATPIATPPGSYKLKLVVVLISASGDPAHRIFDLDYAGLKLGEN